jgi:hypothetical protein
MLTHELVTSALLKWMEEFVEVPHPSLGGWSPCPFARQARLLHNIDIRPGINPLTDCLQSEHDTWNKEVIVYWYDHTKFLPEAFVADVEQANRTLLKKDIVALEDHPLTDEIIGGVKMNFGYCAIIVLQKNSKLNQAADQLREKGYYHSWSQEDLDKIVSWRHK